MPEAATVTPETDKAEDRPDARGTPNGGGTITPEHGGQIGNPPFAPGPEMRRDVEAWVRAGATREDIATLLEVSTQTVDRHFKRELALGRAKLKVALGGKAAKMALEGDRTMLIFWLRTQGRWNSRVEHTGADGGPIRTYDLSAFQLDEKRLLLGVIDQLLAQHEGEGHGNRAEPDRTSLN